MRSNVGQQGKQKNDQKIKKSTVEKTALTERKAVKNWVCVRESRFLSAFLSSHIHLDNGRTQPLVNRRLIMLLPGNEGSM